MSQSYSRLTPYIIFIAIILILLVGGVLVWQQSQEPLPPPPPPIDSGDQENGSSNDIQSSEIPEGWKTYRNEELGFELAYPGEWFLYDKAKWERDNEISQCSQIESIETSMILSQKDLGRCVGVPPGDGLKPGDLVITVVDRKFPLDSPNALGEDPEATEKIQIGGIIALKAPMTENSGRPRNKTINIYTNYKERAYVIEFTQDDIEGNYNPIFDAILFTFRFLK